LWLQNNPSLLRSRISTVARSTRLAWVGCILVSPDQSVQVCWEAMGCRRVVSPCIQVPISWETSTLCKFLGSHFTSLRWLRTYAC
jgi:hypothetical protein